MNKKNAFTLVELIAVIAILSVILVMFVPSLLNSINNNKTKALNKLYDLIETAARNYVMDYNISTPTKIELEDLCETTYIECPIINPNTEEELNGYIFVGNDYYYSEEENIKLDVNYDNGETTQTFNQNYEPGTIIELNNVTKESYSFLGWEVVDGNSVIKDNKLTIGTTKTTIKPKLVRYLNNYIKYLYDNETTRESNGLTNPITTHNNVEYDTGIRYAGADPNNYVYFNCEDKDSNNVNYGEENYNYANSCEVWRMIGVFEVDNGSGKVEKRVKLINTASTFSASWDSSASTVNNGFGINQWGESKYEDGTLYEGADLKKLLNEYYVNKKGANCEYCNARNQSTCSNTCDEESLKSSNMKVLTVIAKEMIEQVVWKTGALVNMDEKPILTVYQNERESINGKVCVGTTYDNGIYCTDNVERTTKWIGLIGLIYPSDYGYASTNEECYNDIFGADSTCEISNWLHPSGYYWTITSLSSASISYATTYVHSTYKLYTYDGHSSGVVRPSLYLKSNVHTIGGDGTEDSPYKLAI